LTDGDEGSRPTTTRRDCLLGAAAILTAGVAAAPAAAAPVAAGPGTVAASGGCTPFRRVYLQK
jgi:hypothetical protein